MINITNGVAEKKTAVALGYFDGLHLGHVQVINAALSQKGLTPAVFTFNCDTTLPKFSSPEDIISFENKCDMMERMGVEYVYAPDFAEVCTLTEEEFVRNILFEKLKAGFACCGRNFRFGLGGHGTPESLSKIGAKYGITVEVVPDVCLDGEMISSTRIREYIKNGEMEQANRLLGYELWFNLPVVHGNEIGRTMNFPTINQIIPETNVIPKFGVYSSYVRVGGKNYRGITNIGIRPTVQSSGKVVMETHILDFNGELYGQKAEVSLCRFLREERKFSSIDELKKQIAQDINESKKLNERID